ncbi:synaptobrevin-domain-containing protein [Chytriomyces cf. hyalinus JEL632]|nr:synaptobrevin-domain-containing protein [Chytriomyces cf. hyalinus JEL632]
MSSHSRTTTPEPNQARSNKAAEVQNQVNEVMDIMHNNIEKAVARGEKLESISHKAEDLKNGAAKFKKNAVKLHDNLWWKDFKMKVVLFLIAATVIGIVGYAIYAQTVPQK